MSLTLKEAAAIGRRLSAISSTRVDETQERLKQLEATVDALRKTIERTERKIERYELGRSLISGRPVSTTPEIAEVRDLIVWVAERMHVTPDAMLSKCRRATIVWPRHVAMWLARRTTGYSLNTIGRSFRRDHSAIIHGDWSVEQQRKTSAKRFEQTEAVLRSWLEHKGKS